MSRLGLTPVETPHAERVAAHYARPLLGKVLVTTPVGQWLFMSEDDYKRYLKGGISNEEPLGSELRKRGLFRDYLDFAALGRMTAKRLGLNAKGPSVHVVYGKLSEKTAAAVLDFILTSPSPELTIRLERHNELFAHKAATVNADGKRHVNVVDGVKTSAEDERAGLTQRVKDPETPRNDGALSCFVYGADGSVYAGTGGELPRKEDAELFRIGVAGKNPYPEALEHPALRAFLLAESALAQPMCAQCAYSPYCPVRAEFNHRTQGSPFGHMPTNERCRRMMGLFGVIFEELIR
ncbi:MAG: hypothetical protein HYZ75_06915 [Elusimicrobia bacterium]|nr:hypothetical protein [Elusimicrobiota bacterium]